MHEIFFAGLWDCAYTAYTESSVMFLLPLMVALRKNKYFLVFSRKVSNTLQYQNQLIYLKNNFSSGVPTFREGCFMAL